MAYIWLTFNNTIEQSIVLKCFEKKWFESCRQMDPRLYYEEERITVQEGSNPDQIEWSNLDNSNLSICLKVCVSYLVAFAIFFGAYLFLSWLNKEVLSLQLEFSLDTQCSSLPVQFTPTLAFVQDWAEVTLYPGYLNCYCLAKLT